MNEEHIIIGKDRFITVPDSLKRIAVQYDHNIETVTFDCPRYWDEHDLSKMDIYVNYCRDDGVSNRTKCTTVRTSETKTEIAEDIMEFDWTVPREATAVDGNLAILICIKQTEAVDGAEGDPLKDAVLVRDWNSEMCTDLYISRGLEVISTGNPEQYRDTFEGWYHSLLDASLTDVKQTTTSTENFGVNVITATFGDGRTKSFEIRNGGVTPNTQIGYNYIINITSVDWMYNAGTGLYEVKKHIDELSSDHVVFPSVSNNSLWINNGLDIKTEDKNITVSVTTRPINTVTIYLVLVNTVNGGIL